MKRSRLRSRRKAPTTAGRPSLARHEYVQLVASLTVLASGRYENPWCRVRERLDPHHIVKRSQGGADESGNIIMLCRRCHSDTDRPVLDAGWLGVASLGADVFTFSRAVKVGTVDGEAHARTIGHLRHTRR